MIRTPKAAALLFAVTIPLLFTACTDEQVAQFQALDPAGQTAVIAALQTPTEPAAHEPPGGFLACVRRHESGGNYQAENPVSTASGAYQFLDSTWRTMSARAGHSGYGHAASAPPHIQDAVAVHTVNSGWSSAWNGTGC
jgi:resuscitation-promoting factor RpfA